MTLENSRHDAYCAFMRRHRSTVWRVCWRYARHGRGGHEDRKARAEDMAQEVWIVLWLKFDQFDLAATSGLTLSRDAVYQRISRIMKKLRNYGR